MDCSCQIDGCDAWDVAHDYAITDPTARKTHTCYECSRKIEPGEKYERFVSFGDGSASTYKTCLDCLSVRDILFCRWIFGEIWQELQEQIINGTKLSETCIAMLTKTARNRVCDMIEESWDE